MRILTQYFVETGIRYYSNVAREWTSDIFV